MPPRAKSTGDKPKATQNVPPANPVRIQTQSQKNLDPTGSSSVGLPANPSVQVIPKPKVDYFRSDNVLIANIRARKRWERVDWVGRLSWLLRPRSMIPQGQRVYSPVNRFLWAKSNKTLPQMLVLTLRSPLICLNTMAHLQSRTRWPNPQSLPAFYISALHLWLKTSRRNRKKSLEMFLIRHRINPPKRPLLSRCLEAKRSALSNWKIHRQQN